ncbi:MAG: hypothetical protein GY874_01030 [Desulfobacteraceae bacterium]|nr:hypothetical protein [Desulfobacteraceae bacterium]
MHVIGTEPAPVRINDLALSHSDLVPQFNAAGFTLFIISKFKCWERPPKTHYVYEAGALDRPDKGKAAVIDEKILEKERENDFEVSRIQNFRYRTRYFTDSGVIGSQEFIRENYQRFKHLFQSKNEKKPKPIKGLDGIYSLKRLSNTS